jgi:hypothetical protein
VELAEGPSPGTEEVEFQDSTMCNKPYIGIPQGICRELGYQTNLGGASSRVHRQCWPSVSFGNNAPKLNLAFI